jgi:hypothetical protein
VNAPSLLQVHTFCTKGIPIYITLRHYKGTTNPIYYAHHQDQLHWDIMQYRNTCKRVCPKFPDWPPGARTANGIALCQWVKLYRYFVGQNSGVCRHNPLCCFSTSVYCCKRMFSYDSVRKLLDTPWYTLRAYVAARCSEILSYDTHSWEQKTLQRCHRTVSMLQNRQQALLPTSSSTRYA